MAMEKDTSDMSKRTSPLRILTTTCLFDGHDASINIVRRLLQARGAEVIHLGINRSVQEVVVAALQENVDAIAISSYQGGHNQYLLYLLDYLKEQGAKLAVFVGGGATITSAEARSLEQAGVTRVYTSADKLNLDTMITDLIQRLTAVRQPLQDISWPENDVVQNSPVSDLRLGQWLSSIENDLPYYPPNKQPSKPSHKPLCKPLCKPQKVVMGITGTGGAGKSTFIDELLQALLALYPHIRIAYLAVDPSWKKTGGALLGDRIRINALPDPRLYMRSMATRQANVSLSQSLQTCIPVLINQGFDLILIESAGIGQNDSSIVDLVDYSIYLMTKDYGSSSQLEKIEMLQFADAVILNKADQQGSEDAFADIQRQWHFHHPTELDAPIFPIVANHYQDHGFNRFIAYLTTQLPFAAAAKQQAYYQQMLVQYPQYDWTITESRLQLANPDYLTTICRQQEQLASEHVQQIDLVNKIKNCYQMLADFNDPCLPPPLESYKQTDNLTIISKGISKDSSNDAVLQALRQRYDQQLALLASPLRTALHDWFNKVSDLDEDSADQEYGEHEDHFVSLSGTCIPHVTRPDEKHWDQIAKYMLDENAPGNYPFTAGVYSTRHTAEDPTRMFAGEGMPEDTNRRFHYLIRGQKSIRLSTAFDPNSLYGHDPGVSPDVFACIGMSGVSIATLDDMKLLYSGVDLCDPATSVSMTINGPAAIFMAWFLHTAIDQQVELYLTNTGKWATANAKIETYLTERGIGAEQRPVYRQNLPTGHNGLGLALLGMSGEMLMVDLLSLGEEYQQLKQITYSKVRGTLQADILKEEIAQNECIFSLDFSLKLMADMQAYFTAHTIAKFYPVSVSGYHIGEAGANPVTQLAFTLANGFTLLEYFLAQGLSINDVAPRLSFFFSNGMDPEYAVIGRVARRIWARTLKQVYKANAHSQKLKYHIQTSGRSLQSQEIDLNDIRTSLQALYAVCDNCNSLHTNAFDETITTPTEDSVYRALSIQSIINREFGLNKNHNPLQGSYLIRQLTEDVEKAVYQEFARLARRGGVLGAIETGYQRNQIQQQSLYYEDLKSNQKLDVIGVNCMNRKLAKPAINKPDNLIENTTDKNKLVRCSNDKKQQQIDGVLHFQYLHRHEAKSALIAMQAGFGGVENNFQQLMTVAPLASLSELTQVLYQVGGKYRRNM